MKLNIQHDFAKLADTIKHAGKQARFAAAVALTRTGQEVKAAQQSEIDRVIDRPTRYTRNSVFLAKAKPDQLYAEVWLKHGNRRTHYLEPLIEGGARPLKRFEQRMVMTGYLKSGERLVPSRVPGRDQYGNLGRGAYTRILSQLRTAVVQGDFSNASNSAKSKAKRATQEFFWSAGPGTSYTYFRTVRTPNGGVNRTPITVKQHLRRGVWMVQRTAFGNAVRPVLYAVDGVSYRKVYDFYGVARKVRDQRFAAHFDAALRQALATAR